MPILTTVSIVSLQVLGQAQMDTLDARVPLRVQPFTPGHVRLLDGPFKDAMDRDAAYLLKLEPDRLLAGFREDAGLPPKAERYGAWETQGVAGHTLGHYLSACSKMYPATHNEQFRERVTYIVDELAACQDANGNGYVAAIPDGKRVFAELARGEIRSQGFDLNGCWVPWYTTHKVMAGLRDAYLFTANEKALTVCRKLADWALATTDALTDEQIQQMLRCEHGGMKEVAADLSAITGENKYLELANRFTHRAVLDPLANGQDQLNGLHANTQIPKLTGCARQYELSADEYFRRAAEFFWKTVTTNHTYVTGGNSDGEHFGPPGQLSKRLSPNTTETCNTYNMLKLTRHLFLWTAAPEYADYYERALFNHILASQEPEHGAVTYYVPLLSGKQKTYQGQFDAFTCCVGTGMENHAQYPDAIYFHDDESLYVNLFIASEVEWAAKGVTLRQETRFPEQDTSRLTIQCEKPVDMTLRIRHPYWATSGVSVRVNGDEADSPETKAGYIALKRIWKDGDFLEIRLPMTLRTEAMPDNPNRAAILYGPLVLAAALGKEEVPPAQVPVLVTQGKDISQWLRPLPNTPLTFETAGVARPKDVQLIPFYKMHHQAYIVYWDFFTQAEWERKQAEYRAEQKRLRELESRTLDFVQPGEMQPERDHAFEGEKTRCGAHLDRKWRDATDGGHFSFTMKVDPERPVQLICAYWGSDTGGRAFDILVDENKIATQTLDNPKPGEFVDVVYDIPKELTRGKKEARVTFQAHPGMMAGGVFGCRVVRSK